MRRSNLPAGFFAPALSIVTLSVFLISAVMPYAAAARERRSPSSGVRREERAQKTPARVQEASAKDRAKDHTSRPAAEKRDRPPSSGTTYRKKSPREFDRKPPPSGKKEKQPDEAHNDGGYTIESPPRRHDDDPGSGERRIPARRRYPGKKGEKKYRWPGDPVTPVIPGGHCIPPYISPIHYHDTYSTNIYNVQIIYPRRYRYYPICLPGLLDGELYDIYLPFGPILPWEIGEFYLIRLKNLEKEGLGGSMMITIIQTRDEMGWEEFLARFEDRITDVRYYGPVGRTAFLMGMTVSDILDLMLDNEIRWAGEFYPDYKIVPGGRNTKFYVLSLEGDTIEFRRALRDAGVYVMRYDQETEEYFVRSSQDIYSRVASLWWVARVSGVSGEPFFQPEDEWIEVGMAP